jgi:DNA processing protein
MTTPDPAWVALSLVEYIGGIKLRALVAHFGSADAVLRASSAELRRVPGIGAKIARGISSVDLSAIERDMRRWRAKGIRIITQGEPAYPAILLTVDDAPATLFVRGRWSPAHVLKPRIAIVGTRNPTERALKAAHKLGLQAAERGFSVVSGLAFGIDQAAHSGALAFPDGVTLAVLGGGVLNVYPREHERLAHDICEYGALLGETHPDCEPKPSTLVARNRIISGLSAQVVVVETSDTGGAMYAARRALAQGRALYTLDLPASGNQMLIREGARVLSPDHLVLPVDED